MDMDICQEQQFPSAILMGITFGILTEDDKEKLSVRAINATSEITDPDLGLPNLSSECSTCRAKDFKSCEGHFGVIKFPFTVLHPYFLSEVVQILNKVCPGCKSVRRDLVLKVAGLTSREPMPKGCKYCGVKSTGWYPRMKFKISSNEGYRKSAIVAIINEKAPSKNLMKGFNQKLADDYWDIIPKDEQQDENDIKPNKRVLTHAQVCHLLKNVDPNFIRRFVSKADSIFLNSFPVTPNGLRVTEVVHAFSNGQRLIFDERTRAYKKLVDFRGTANELSSRVLDCLKASKINPDHSLDGAINAMQKRSCDATSKETGLRWIKVSVLGKRNDHCFRMVVVGDPNLKLDEIGIPCQIAERLQIAEHLTSWNSDKLIACCEVRLLEKGDMHVRREGSLVRIRCTEELRIGDIIYRPLADGDKVLINRPPSIHKHSLIALSVKVIPVTSALAINPLCCSPFHGDFDGDCLHGYVPQSVATRVELSELVDLHKQLSNAQSGRNLLALSQDSLVAAHLIMDDGVLLNKFQMQQLEMLCPRQFSMPAILKAPSLEGCFWTGRQLISILLPRGFDYHYPFNNICIHDGELISSEGSFSPRDTDNLFQSLVKNCPGQVLDFLHAAQQVLCEWLSMRGLTVSLDDLYLAPDYHSRKNMMEEISCGLKEAENTCNLNQLMVDSCRAFLAGNGEDDQYDLLYDEEHLCYEKQRSAVLSQTSADAFMHVFRDIQGLYYKYACKENALLAMFKAGSKGNLSKLVQHSMCLGLQHSLVPLSYRMPHQLLCAAWNNQKAADAADCVKNYIPSAVVESSFLTGLNPAECFVHSATSRESSFSDNADVPGTLNRKLMFFLRDIYSAYDGTVRNSYGNQVVQFSYGDYGNEALPASGRGDVIDDYGGVGGHPVGALAACAISEAAYSALDQPISLLEKSPLLSLKNILECGQKKSNAHQTMTLFLSDKLGRQRHGIEYGALEVQNHLERLLFSDVVSFVRMIFNPQNCGSVHLNPWVCHFHVSKEILKKRNLGLQSIIGTLCKQCESKANISVEMACKDCFMVDSEEEKKETLCMALTVIERSKNSATPLDKIQDLIPFLLETVIKGFMEIKKVDILWNDKPKIPKSRSHPRGELFLRVSMSAGTDRTRLWNLLLNDCLPIMDMIDWTRSHPNNVYDFCLAYGIDAGWKFFLNSLKAAISDGGKTILPQHLLLVASCLSVTGEFVGLSSKGLKQQREHASFSSPFVQACFSNPGNCFIKAAKAEATDVLQGSLDALAWGKMPTIGTGQFDILYSGQGHKLSEPMDVYNLLGQEMSSDKRQPEIGLPNSRSYKSEKSRSSIVYKFRGCGLQELKKFQIKTSVLSRYISYDDILSLSRALRNILNKNPLNHDLNETDKATVMTALYFHPRRSEKIGTGAQEIKVINHPEYEGARCFSVVRSDGTVEDFSYHKCVHAALEIIHPQKANMYMGRFLPSRSKSEVEIGAGNEEINMEGNRHRMVTDRLPSSSPN